MHPPLPAHRVRAIAVKAECDPRTVERALRGEPVRSIIAERIERALAAERRRSQPRTITLRTPR